MLGKGNPKVTIVAGVISYLLITFGGTTAKTVGFGIATYFAPGK